MNKYSPYVSAISACYLDLQDHKIHLYFSRHLHTSSLTKHLSPKQSARARRLLAYIAFSSYTSDIEFKFILLHHCRGIVTYGAVEQQWICTFKVKCVFVKDTSQYIKAISYTQLRFIALKAFNCLRALIDLCLQHIIASFEYSRCFSGQLREGIASFRIFYSF